MAIIDSAEVQAAIQGFSTANDDMVTAVTALATAQQALVDAKQAIIDRRRELGEAKTNLAEKARELQRITGQVCPTPGSRSRFWWQFGMATLGFVIALIASLTTMGVVHDPIHGVWILAAFGYVVGLMAVSTVAGTLIGLGVSHLIRWIQVRSA